MNNVNTSPIKQELRKKFTAARRAISLSEAELKSARIARNVFSLPCVQGADPVVVYHKIGAEVDMALLMEMIIDSGRGVALPYSRGDGEMGIGRIWSPGNDLVKGPFGAMEPAERFRENVGAKQVGAVVCPGVAFDTLGGRLGRGGGYYDRFLSQIKGTAQIIGCAFDCQISDAPLPIATHDIRMDIVVTESRAFPKGSCPAISAIDEKSAYANSAEIGTGEIW